MAFLEVDLVIGAILHPYLEDTLDVHLDNVVFVNAVFDAE